MHFLYIYFIYSYPLYPLYIIENQAPAIGAPLLLPDGPGVEYIPPVQSNLLKYYSLLSSIVLYNNTELPFGAKPYL